MARAISTASLSLGLVSIPVGLHATRSRAGRVSYHLVHAKDGSRVKRQYVCEEEGIPVSDDELARAYESEDGEPVVLSAAEAKEAAPSATGRIDLLEFVPADTVDAVYLDNAYYLAPGKGGDRAYHLLAETLRELAVVGIGTQLARGKSYLVMVRPSQRGLVMHTLHYADEVHAEDEVDHGDQGKISAAERDMARLLVEQQRSPGFDVSRFADEADERMRALIAARAGHAPAAEAKPVRGKGQVIDLMAALKASLASQDPAPTPKAKGKGHGGKARRPTSARTTARAARPSRATAARTARPARASSSKKTAGTRAARTRRAAS